MVASSWLHKRDSTRAEPHARQPREDVGQAQTPRTWPPANLPGCVVMPIPRTMHTRTMWVANRKQWPVPLLRCEGCQPATAVRKDTMQTLCTSASDGRISPPSFSLLIAPLLPPSPTPFLCSFNHLCSYPCSFTQDHSLEHIHSLAHLFSPHTSISTVPLSTLFHPTSSINYSPSPH